MIDRSILLKFEESTTEDQLQQVVERFKSLRKHLTGVVDLQAGLNISDRNQGYQVVLTVRFEDMDALDAYEENPEHHKCSAFIRESGRLDGIVVDIEI
ncbi:Dabb family protein [Aquibacillus albus]|uniref:Heme-degrading monooxygenase HmoA n=1 Tax=Aquibacillus albus TaxID=1168171 RepID=A0ABS2MWE4_9BACI|nr:Dabb family protein [Aquibacillus albus]MBM7570217.1 heme-degrading monooxygenase HmoA [Aquibacillus albus]